jgi:opacity protein-like surface antigen
MKRLLFVLFTFHLSLFTASAQSDDFGLDFSLEAEKKLSKKWSLGFEGELRTRDNTKTVDRWSGGLSADFKITKWLKASAGYNFLYDNNERITYKTTGAINKEAHYWGVRHRFNVSLTASQKISNLKFSLRERWQYTYRPEKTVDRWDYDDEEWEKKTYNGKGTNVLRSRLQIEYDKKGLAITPYANVEFFNAWSLQKTRFHVGADWKLSKQHTIGAFYRYQTVRDDEDDNEPNIHMIGLSYKFKF